MRLRAWALPPTMTRFFLCSRGSGGNKTRFRYLLGSEVPRLLVRGRFINMNRELFPAEDLRGERRANDERQDQRRNIAHMGRPCFPIPNSLKQGHSVGERQDTRDDLQLRRKRFHGDEEAR